ncbi:transporter [uncultured Sphingomonas sp.]|uniref:transporter n=1 Tax=uncultured Sphingomonas sp. TaxID=158754 RepID=UPI0035CC19C0
MWAVLALLAAGQGVASAPPADRREMSTDRPDKTESPYTVDAGRFQIELDAATYTRDRSGGVRAETVSVAPVNLKLGLDRTTDLHVIVEPYLRRTVTDRRLGTRETAEGLGDVTVRVKRNLWGDDDGRTAFAIMPFVTLPTSKGGLGAGKVEFGVVAPLAIALSDRIGLGLMTELDVIEDDATEAGGGSGYRASFVNSATFGFALTERLGMYTELFTERGEDWVVTGDVGFTYAVSDYTQLDAGANLGVTRAADDLAVFVGLSRRF